MSSKVLGLVSEWTHFRNPPLQVIGLYVMSVVNPSQKVGGT